MTKSKMFSLTILPMILVSNNIVMLDLDRSSKNAA